MFVSNKPLLNKEQFTPITEKIPIVYQVNEMIKNTDLLLMILCDLRFDKYAQQRDIDAETKPDKLWKKLTSGHYTHNNLVYVPEGETRLLILDNCHDSPSAGHGGIAKTMDFVLRNWWWPGLKTTVEEYVKSCDHCQRAKTRIQAIRRKQILFAHRIIV
jgi:hypothetical protein